MGVSSGFTVEAFKKNKGVEAFSTRVAIGMVKINAVALPAVPVRLAAVHDASKTFPINGHLSTDSGSPKGASPPVLGCSGTILVVDVSLVVGQLSIVPFQSFGRGGPGLSESTIGSGFGSSGPPAHLLAPEHRVVCIRPEA
jgi:hypothetical protein